VSSSVAGSRDIIEVEYRDAEDEGATKIALQKPSREDQVLLPEWPVEAVAGDGLGANPLVRVGRQQDVDRIADRVDADEDQDRHGDHDDDGLEQALDDEAEHAVRGSETGRGDNAPSQPPTRGRLT
jgi:hypothetical protein